VSEPKLDREGASSSKDGYAHLLFINRNALFFLFVSGFLFLEVEL